jgi:hypothetical protein
MSSRNSKRTATQSARQSNFIFCGHRILTRVMYSHDNILQLADSRLNPHRVRGWGLKADHAKRLKEREENSKQKRMVAESSIDERLLQNLRRGNF